MAQKVYISSEAVRRIVECLIVLLLLAAVIEWALSFTVKRKVSTRGALTYASMRDLATRPAKDASFYERVFASRNLFRGKTLEVLAPPSPRIDELAKNIQLIGVIQSDIQEAILKDGETKSTYFVRAGSEVGQLEIKEVRKRSVVLRYGSEEKEIFLQ